MKFRYQFVNKGFSAKLSDEELKSLEADPRIKRVTPNFLISYGIDNTTNNIRFLDDKAEESLVMNQSTSWGVVRVGGPFEGSGIGRKAWVIDSGIDLTHSDLNVDLNNSESFIQGENANDTDGHGTHVAGIIGSTGNTTNVVGVAAGATVVAVKVCSPQLDPFPCPLGSVLAGINYVTNNVNPGDIVNMSLWNEGGILPDLDDAVLDAANSGVRFTLIAGNANANAANFSPGRVNHPNVWTMSAFRQGDIFANTSPTNSNSGNPPIDFAAPGELISSLWKNGGTHTISGTSMAAPHVAGLLLACGETGLDTDGTVSNDPRSPADPIAWGFKPSFVSNVTHSVVPSQVSPGYYNPKLDWSPLSGAIGYEIQRKHWLYDWKLWAAPSSTSYTDIMTNSQNLQAFPWGQPTNYWVAYRIRAVNECGGGPWSQTKYFTYDPNDSIPTFAEGEDEVL